jgi:hypothetical protein
MSSLIVKLWAGLVRTRDRSKYPHLTLYLGLQGQFRFMAVLACLVGLETGFTADLQQGYQAFWPTRRQMGEGRGGQASLGI